MYKVGITGGIGSGKTLICKIFEILGVPVFYADREARKLMEEKNELRCSIIQLLGEAAYADDRLNSSYISSVVFSDRNLLEQLNAIVHPAVQGEFQRWVKEMVGVPYVIEEAAILIESGAADFLDSIVLIYASQETRVRRVMERDGTDEDSVRTRMKSQLSEEKKLELADFVIHNEPENMLIPQVVELHEKLLKRSLR